jgi:hypothetical protein
MGNATTGAEPKEMFRVEAPHFTAGIIMQGERVTNAPPILAWAKSRTRTQLRKYFAKKGWRVTYVQNLPESGIPQK